MLLDCDIWFLMCMRRCLALLFNFEWKITRNVYDEFLGWADGTDLIRAHVMPTFYVSHLNAHKKKDLFSFHECLK